MTMCIENTPVTWHPEVNLYVKHEEQCCPGGPNFSKTRGVYAHIAKRTEHTIGVLDTSHSQGGWAVTKACMMLGKQPHLWYPAFKQDLDKPLKPQQFTAQQLGAHLHPLKPGRSAILYHTASKLLREVSNDFYMLPNALKLPESVDETAAEVERTDIPTDINAVLVPASSGTIAAGVLRALADKNVAIVVHLGYSRPEDGVRKYLSQMSGITGAGDGVTIIDEGYNYADAAKNDIELPPWPCDKYYDLKTYRYWLKEGQKRYGKALLWNIG